MMLDFGWILIGLAKTPQRLFKVEILTSDFQRCINVRVSALDQRLVFNVGPTLGFQRWIDHTHICHRRDGCHRHDNNNIC